MLTCASETPAAVALGALGIDTDELWAALEHARAEARADREVLEAEIQSAQQAKEREIEAQHFEQAAKFRDQERALTQKLRATAVPLPGTLAEVRRRLGLVEPEELGGA